MGEDGSIDCKINTSIVSFKPLSVTDFVEDPLIVARATDGQLNSIYNVVLLWWLTLGLKVAWSKGALGPEAEWIGAKLVVNDREGFVRVMVAASKLEEWRVLLEGLDTRPVVGRKPLQQFTGKMSWAAGFIATQPFVRMLYAAMASQPGKLRGQEQVYHKMKVWSAQSTPTAGTTAGWTSWSMRRLGEEEQ